MSVEHLRTLTAREVAAELTGDKAGAWDTGAVRFGLDTFRIVYRTVDPGGRPTTASGLVALPHSGERRLRTVSFTHGTELFKDVASVSTSVWDQAPALICASAGFATVLPDYLGLGLGSGPHPWMDVPSETTAALDMLRASRALVAAKGRELRREVLVIGFSQGASAALGLARSLQDGADGWFRLRAVAPTSGAYAFRDAELPERTEPKAGVIHAALPLVAFNRLHHLYDTPAQVFRAPYDRTIEGLLDGTHTGQEVVAGTPGSLDALLTSRGRMLLAQPTGRLASAPTGRPRLRSGSTTPTGTSRPSPRTPPTARPPCAPEASMLHWSASAPRTTAARAIWAPAGRNLGRGALVPFFAPTRVSWILNLAR
ncbi:hypothetical protein OHS70_36505 [Streptomyces sp. NBC_00390]|uniref:hypothetical protein n=1 Tax=Streptomyces sp. NBC_00390 TaxID=2975736 RepID=UPI002E1D05B8